MPVISPVRPYENFLKASNASFMGGMVFLK
jgi:hypothetical protein